MTLVIVALSLTVLVMFAGLAVDVARMRVYRTQLSALADAAALSMATDLRYGRRRGEALREARLLRGTHRLLDGRMASLAGRDVQPGQWDFRSGRFVASSWAEATATRVGARYTARWTLARIFGVRTTTLNSTAIASLGAVGSSRCLTPFALPYSALLQQLGRSSATGADPLEVSDLALLRRARTETAFTITATGPSAPGTVSLVALRGGTGSATRLAAQLRPGCRAPTIAVGDALRRYTGSLTAATVLNALDGLCPGSAPLSNRRCTPAPVLEVPLVRDVAGAPQVEMVGAFQLTRVALDGVNDQIFGFFTAAAAQGEGSFLPRIGPVTTSALVQ